ncbi:cation-transporting P-type ATPase [Microbacterium elymi]|uniref:Cation-transporting P-type ATPase n=1 Tax=Microbacterium elymi TaxID=2909587 RepID=A0ABY5NI65_9MICO|nr:cation-transporting P-type ATPase [Microbacterium elymi]UUT34838.1 cation-transporting P-type ATPase [Microbacterium elymi]
MLASVGSTPAGLSDIDVTARRERFGPNALREHRARPLRVLGRQLRARSSSCCAGRHWCRRSSARESAHSRSLSSSPSASGWAS